MTDMAALLETCYGDPLFLAAFADWCEETDHPWRKVARLAADGRIGLFKDTFNFPDGTNAAADIELIVHARLPARAFDLTVCAVRVTDSLVNSYDVDHPYTRALTRWQGWQRCSFKRVTDGFDWLYPWLTAELLAAWPPAPPAVSS